MGCSGEGGGGAPLWTVGEKGQKDGRGQMQLLGWCWAQCDSLMPETKARASLEEGVHNKGRQRCPHLWVGTGAEDRGDGKESKGSGHGQDGAGLAGSWEMTLPTEHSSGIFCLTRDYSSRGRQPRSVAIQGCSTRGC